MTDPQDLARLTDGLRPVPDSLTRALDDLERLVGRGRGVPMSSSVMVNRKEFEEVVQSARSAIPPELRSARALLAERAQVIEEARAEADRIVAGAEARRRKVLQRSTVVRQARAEADRIVATATERAAAARLEADDYVERRLANFEVVLTKTLHAVERGRLKLRGRLREADLGDLAAPWSELDARLAPQGEGGGPGASEDPDRDGAAGDDDGGPGPARGRGDAPVDGPAPRGDAPGDERADGDGERRGTP